MTYHSPDTDWIPVTTMPPDRTRVLVWGSQEDTGYEPGPNIAAHADGTWWTHRQSGRRMITVTHWMPLPEGPR